MTEKLHIVQQHYRVDRQQREASNRHKSACLWFTGLSGSGKSTLANQVEQELFSLGYKTYVLDGDNIRSGLNKGLTFTETDRVENIRRIGEVANLLCDAGLVVLAAFVSPFRADRKMVKELIGESFQEIFVDAPIPICEQRDVKGLYQKARSGAISNFTGISSPFEAPENPDIQIQTDQYTIEESVERILGKVLPILKL